MKKPTLKVTADFTKDFNGVIASLKKSAVMVGIPSEENDRSSEDGPIGNAAILAINHYGSPANNIPARPVLTIGIERSRDAVAQQLKKAAEDALTKGSAGVTVSLERAGSIAANSVKKTINDQFGIEPPAPATIRARESRGFAGKKALIVTGQMRNAITYVVVEN